MTDIPEGSVVQLHVKDPHWAQQNILKQLQVMLSGLEAATLGKDLATCPDGLMALCSNVLLSIPSAVQHDT